MFPEDIRKAIQNNTPVILPVGVLEYHSEHCVLGVDTILVVKALEILEKERDLVILPPFFYGAASFVVESPEEKGTLHVKPGNIYLFARDLFHSLLRVGFRNIYVFIHHQSENFLQGMPTDLAFRLAGREAIFEFLRDKWGEGWWGKESMKDYYTRHSRGENPFNWIKVLPFMEEKIQEKFPIDHAGKQETSLMLAFAPEGVDRGKFTDRKWYSLNARDSSISYGEKIKEEILSYLRRVIK